MFEKTLSSEVIFQGNVINVRIDQVALPGGKESKREIVEHKGAAAIIPCDSNNNVICVKQFRKAAEKVMLEIPAGKLEDNEKAEDCARRELEEETGFRPGSLQYLCSFYPTPGYANEIIHLFLAENLQAVDVAGDEDEYLKVTKIPLHKTTIMDLIQKGSIIDGKTIIGLLVTLFMKEDIKTSN